MVVLKIPSAMYSLFEMRKILSVSNPGGAKGVKILLSAFAENASFSVLAVVCDNGYLIFRYTSKSSKTPVIRQLCWFNNSEKEIKALSFDSSGMWLLTVTFDATLYIIPMSHFMSLDVKVSAFWKTDNLTEIKLSGQRALTTAVQWWQTHESEHIAITGSELGEISFINLVNKKEVGGTYITSSISALDILYDESHDTTYLLITGNNQQQWRLLLEEKKTNFYWPFNTESEITSYNSGKAIPLAEKITMTEEKLGDQKPHRLSKFESGTFLTPQCGDGRNLVSAYNSTSCLLQVLEGDLDQMHLFSYKVPPDCENIILSDKLIFTILRNHSSDKHIFKIFSRKLAEISSENSKKKEPQNAEIQKFQFSSKILALYKVLILYPDKESDQKGITLKQSSILPEKVSPSSFISETPTPTLLKDHIMQSLGALKSEKKMLEGCILVQEDCVWECKLRVSPEALFLSLTASPSDLPFAEKLGVMLSLDLHKLYDIAADGQLSSGQFAQAVHLYQLSKCPQLKRIAHFMGYGFLSELIAYIQVLFSTKGVEIVSPDKCHFANIALHCFAHQVKNKLQDKNVITSAFKKFLKENSYYDEEVAGKLLAEQGLFELLHYFSKVRSQQGLTVETLLSIDGIKCTIDDVTSEALVTSGYNSVLYHSNDDHYMKCLTSYHLLQFLAAKPTFLNKHLQHSITLLPSMDIFCLKRVAQLYDPSRKLAKLFFRNLSTSKMSKSYWSLSSLVTVSSDVQYVNHKIEDISTVEDIMKFFIFVLLMLCHKLGYPKFCKDLLDNEMQKIPNKVHKSHLTYSSSDPNINAVDYSPLSCGQAHVAYVQKGVLYTWGKSGNGRLGTEEIGYEYLSPQPVITLLRLQVNVLSVSCGALHSLAITDYGVFGWGSSRFGQLGMGNVQQAVQPRIIESLVTENIVKVHCGQYHSIALTAEGKVYTWGWGIHGQLGHGNAEDLNFPKAVASLSKKTIVSIAAGQGHTVLLSRNGDVYTFGCGMFGQLGTGSVLKQSHPCLVNIPERIKLIASGYFHVLAVSRINKVYTWGCNPQALRLQAQNSRRARHHGSSMNQNYPMSHHSSSSSSSSNSSLVSRSVHPNGSVQQSHLLPNLVNTSSITDAIIQVSCGSHHSVIVTACGKMFSWGRNTEGQIGNGTRKEQKIPNVVSTLKDKKILHAACGADFTITVDSNGKIYGWGQNDGCQIGQKPSYESNTKYNSGSSGRVITIRTNRRMITITQPCRQSILRPVEINLPQHEMGKGEMLDSASFESENSVMSLMVNFDSVAEGLDLSNLSDPYTSLLTLHAALKMYHHYCEPSTLLNHCVKFGNFQAAAKLCALEKNYDQALEYQLSAFASHSADIDLQMALYIINLYTSKIDHENIETNQKFICLVINFWLKNNLSVSILESFFVQHHHIFIYPLTILMFRKTDPDSELKIPEEFFNMMSTKFCLNLVNGALQEMQQGHHIFNFLDEMSLLSVTAELMNRIHVNDALTTWDDSIPQERLWLDMMLNMQTGVISQSFISLSANDVDLLAKSSLSEKFFIQSSNNSVNSLNKLNPNGKDAVIFSCGHYHTLLAFHSNVLPSFRDSLQSNFYSVPSTIRTLLSEYNEDVITAACPKCAATEITSEL